MAGELKQEDLRTIFCWLAAPVDGVGLTPRSRRFDNDIAAAVFYGTAATWGGEEMRREQLPEVEDITIRVVEINTGKRWGPEERTYSGQRERIPCNNPQCLTKMGIPIGAVLKEMTEKRQTDYTGVGICESPRYVDVQKCMNSFSYTITIKYKQKPAAAESEISPSRRGVQ